MKFKTFTGGPYATNCFAAATENGLILFDAPEGADEVFSGEKIGLLVLTHGHWDHVADAAAIRARHNCQVVCHEDTVPMVSEPDFFVRQGFPFRLEPVAVDRVLREGKAQELLGWKLDVLDVPGQCPGSLCFFSPRDGILIGGDVLFRGSIGRTDFPGGSFEQLAASIRQKLYVLPGKTVVYPGHGPTTTIDHERRTNRFVTAE